MPKFDPSSSRRSLVQESPCTLPATPPLLHARFGTVWSWRLAPPWRAGAQNPTREEVRLRPATAAGERLSTRQEGSWWSGRWRVEPQERLRWHPVRVYDPKSRLQVLANSPAWRGWQRAASVRWRRVGESIISRRELHAPKLLPGGSNSHLLSTVSITRSREAGNIVLAKSSLRSQSDTSPAIAQVVTAWPLEAIAPRQVRNQDYLTPHYPRSPVFGTFGCGQLWRQRRYSSLFLRRPRERPPPRCDPPRAEGRAARLRSPRAAIFASTTHEIASDQEGIFLWRALRRSSPPSSSASE